MAEKDTQPARPLQTEAHELPGAMPPTSESSAPAPAPSPAPNTTPAPNTNTTAVPEITYTAHPPPPYQAAAQKEATATIAVIPLTHLREGPAVVDCPKCGTRGLTRTDKSPNGQTHCAAVVICCFLSCLLAWLPYVIRSCNDTEHICSHCGCSLAVYKSNGVAHVNPQFTRPTVSTQNATPGSVPAPIIAEPPAAVTK